MKKIILLAIAFVSVLGAKAANQDYEYVPLVRENVKWECFYWGELDPQKKETLYSTAQHYIYEMKGDTVVDGVTYKMCYCYDNPYGKVLNTKRDTIISLLREVDKVVYCRDNKLFIYDTYAAKGAYNFLTAGTYDNEFILYDFNNMTSFYQKLYPNSSVRTDTVTINGTKRVKYASNGDSHIATIEGIGFVSYNVGEVLCPLRYPCNCDYYDYRGLVRVIEGNDTVYEGPALDEYNYWLRTGAVNEVSVNNPNADDRYYDLMGMPVEHPTSGIYIHNGKKVIIR